jgi:dolichyl-phosphate beta-glucosyltransferase
MSEPPVRPGESRHVFLSVIVPAYDEIDRIGDSVRRILAFTARQPYRTELIVVLDGGRPGAAEAVHRASGDTFEVQVLDNVHNRGKGFSVRRGVAAATGRYVMFVDADLSLPIEGANRLLAALENGADVAIGSRRLEASVESGERQPMRRSLGRLFNWLVQRLLLPGISDTQCGFKAFRGPIARSLFQVQRIDRFGFDVEVLNIARRRGYRVVEVPVSCEYHSSSSVRRLRDGASMLADVGRILWRSARGDYDARC